MSSQTDLLYWLSGRIKSYPHLGPIQEINRDTFGNGLALCALLHAYHGDSIVPYTRLNPKHRQLNLEIALAEADALGIPHLMDVADFLHTVCPEIKSTTLLLSYWHEYLALPPEERKAPSHSDEELQRLLSERPARIAGYLDRIEQLEHARLCQRCGLSVDGESDFHQGCTRCLRCGTGEGIELLSSFHDWFCEKCTRFQASLSAASTSKQQSHSDLVRDELRQAELAQLKEKRSGASNPFAEAERLREEEKRKRLAAFREKAVAPAASPAPATTPSPSPAPAPTPVVAEPTTTPIQSGAPASSPTPASPRAVEEKPASTYVFGDRCKACSKVVYATEKITAEKDIFHKACFRCVHCRAQLKLGSYASLEGQYYCKPHFKQLFALKGNYSEGFGKDKPQDEWAAQRTSAPQSPTVLSSSSPSPAVSEVIASPRAEDSSIIETSTPSTPSSGEIKPTATPGKIASPFAELEKQREEERRRARFGHTATTEEPRTSAAAPGKISSPFAQLEAESQRRAPPSSALASTPAPAPSSGRLGENNPFKEAERRREEERRAKMEAILGRRS